MSGFRSCENDISSNARIKEYPTLNILQVANAPIFREPGWEPAKRLYDVPVKGQAQNPEQSLKSSRARAKAAIRDIAFCNLFAYFFTWTLDGKLVDRYDDAVIQKRLSNTLKHLVQRKKFAYLCIPERHKDGALHFHGLCILGNVRIERASNSHGSLLSTNRGQPIYNMLDWPWGFSTCIPIDENYDRVVNYVLKYISKNGEKIFGKWYYSSRNLTKKPLVYLLDRMDYDGFLSDNPDAAVVPVYRDVCIGMKQFSNT